MKDVVSIIVPVYNVENYIECCLESLINQTYRNLEIILIDDGSTDNSGKICDKYASKDERIKVIHQKNGGAANAKNNGLRVATGKYLTFVDSDDYVEIDAYEYMLSVIEDKKADVVQCGYREIYVLSERERIKNKSESYTVTEYLCRYTTDWTCGLLWDKLYKRNLFENIYFEEGHIIDDEYFTYQGIMNAKKIVCDPKIVYNYRQRKSSATGSEEHKSRTVLDRLDYLQKRREKVVERYPELQKLFDNHMFSMLIWLSKDAYVNRNAIVIIKQLISDYKKYRFCCGLSLRQQICLQRIRLLSIDKILNERNEKNLLSTIDFFE